MGVISCPYRGAIIPRLWTGKKDNNATFVCNHPAVQGPCAIAKSMGNIRSCLTCKLWKDSPDTVTENLAKGPLPDPSSFSPPKKTPHVKPKKTRVPIVDCIHRGQFTGDVATCPTGCKTKFKIFECGLFGTCTLTDPGEGVDANCGGCPDAQSPLKGAAKTDAWLQIDKAPRLTLNPVLKRAVITIAVGRAGEALLKISGPLMEAYADRIGADFRVLRWPGHPLWPMSSKYAIPRALDDHNYERIIYIDADVIVPPKAIDLLQACEPDEFGAFDELPFIRRQPQYRQEADALRFREQMGFPAVKLPFYFNCGVMVASRQHIEYLEAPLTPMPIHHCAEQHHTNAMVLEGHRAGVLKVKQLDRRANWQSWTPDFDHAPPDALLHFSAGGALRKRRILDMRLAVASFTKE